jgi:hypothetical protein
MATTEPTWAQICDAVYGTDASNDSDATARANWRDWFTK